MSEYQGGTLPVGYLYCGALPNGQHVDVLPLLFGRARLLVSDDAAHIFARASWDYDDPILAVAAARWYGGTGEPVGWSRDNNVLLHRPNDAPEGVTTFALHAFRCGHPRHGTSR